MSTDARLQFVYDLVDPLRVTPGRKVKLPQDYDPGDTGGLASREEAADRLAEGLALLVDFQRRLWAQNVYGVLLVLQGIDASGKDGIVKHVMSGLNPQGVEVRSFKVPTAEELSRDFLWRYQARLPGRGYIGIYNRSQYEEVLVVRVHPELLEAQRIPERAKGRDIWKRRFDQINDWEAHLVDNGIQVVKIFLNLSRREQAKRFLSRIDDPVKNWKYSPEDIHERHFWDDYQIAFSDMLSHTSTEHAPWYVVPADRKWFARLATAAALVRALAEIDPQYPKVDDEIVKEMAVARTHLLAELGDTAGT